jgi:VWFA-related protein
VRTILSCAFVVAVVGALVVVAQETEQSSGIQPIGGLAFKDEIEVTVVNIVAFVTDKKGNAVTDLTKEDFKLSQDGRERPISNFQLYTEELYRSHFRPSIGPSQEQVPEPLPEALPEFRPSYMTLYVDHENLRPLDRNRVLNQLQGFVRNNCRPPVEMMVASYNRSLKVIQPFTSDANQVMAAIREMRTYTGGRTNRDSDRRDIIEAMERHKQDPESPQGDFYRMQGLVSNFAREEENDLQFTLGALREIITMISGLPGTKSILYVSNGLPMVPGIDLYYSMANAYDEPSLITESTRYAQYRQFESLVAGANSQDVTFYTIGAGGLETVGMASAEYATPMDTMAAGVGHDNYLDSIRFIADGTGGTAIVNTNDIRGQLERVEQDFYTYYSLGYTLQVSGHDKVHKIKVELPNHPEYRLRYRRRFVEKSLENRVQDRVVTGLMFPLEENPMQIACEIGDEAPASEDRWTVPFELSFPISMVAMFPEGTDYVGRVTMYIAARDTKGKKSDVVRQEHEVRVPIAAYEDARRKRFTIVTKLLMEDGSYRVAVGVLDRITRQASYQTLATSVGR